MATKSFYITSPIFYPNAKLHMGHVYTMTVCDILSRFERIRGKDVFFLTGSDENTGKVVKAAAEAGQPVEEFLQEIVDNFADLYAKLGIEYSAFIRTTNKEGHWPGAVALWQKLVEAGDIYKSTYVGLYCPQCETFYTEKDLVDGKCPLHGIVPERLDEENYFFKLSKYTNLVKEKIESGELEIVPETRRNEILALLNRGLEDVSFSRPAATVPHGIPVPGDPSQVMYVWCDALTSYISAVGYGHDSKSFEKWWPANVHVMGKDILRFHAAIWPAMLLSAGLPLPKRLLVHGFILSGGQKMSKSIGNVIDPVELIEEYGPEAVRYYVARKISPFEDGDLTRESFKDAYNGDLANGLGNLTSRIMKMAETHLPGPVETESELHSELVVSMERFEVQKAMNHIWAEIGELDATIQEKEPFKLVKTDPEQGREIITDLVRKIAHIGRSLAPFMPATSEKILAAVALNKLDTGLFPRKE